MTLIEFTKTPEYVAASKLAQKAFETGTAKDAEIAAICYSTLPGRV
jgi:hypothetical protein